MPLSHTEIESWARQTRRYVSGWHLGVIRRMDDAYLATMRRQRERDRARQEHASKRR